MLTERRERVVSAWWTCDEPSTHTRLQPRVLALRIKRADINDKLDGDAHRGLPVERIEQARARARQRLGVLERVAAARHWPQPATSYVRRNRGEQDQS